MFTNEGASSEAIQFHYDVGNDFYVEWLDRNMVYSAALWPDADDKTVTLEQAQDRKLDWHIRAAGLKPGDAILDIGCGWGSLMRRAMERHDLDRAVGLTLSTEQAAWIRDHTADPRITAQICPWQEFRADQPFDALLSIGALEHFARPGMDRAAKLQCYQDFFRFCSDNLSDGGRLSIQSIVWMNMRPEREAEFLPKDLFPESNLPHLIELLDAADPYFHVLECHNRPRDYTRTLREWIRKIRENREALAAAYGMPTVKRYSLGFAAFVLGFENGIMGLSRAGLQKRSTKEW